MVVEVVVVEELELGPGDIEFVVVAVVVVAVSRQSLAQALANAK